jgi:integrase
VAALQEPIRNRVMLTFAYDAGLRREELCSLCTDDIDPSRRTIRVRAEKVVPVTALRDCRRFGLALLFNSRLIHKFFI